MERAEPLSRRLRGIVDPVALMLGGLVVLAGVIPFVAALVLYQLHSQAEVEEAETTARRTATLLLRSFEQAIEPIDALLVNFARDYDTAATPQQVYEMLRGYSLPQAVVQLTVVDRDGVMVASSLAPPGPEKIDLSDREHIRVQMGRDPAKADLFISKPVLGRVSKRWTIQLTRPLGDAQGHFAGVVVASYAISDFIEFYKQLRTEEDMLIGLVGRDGVVRARAARNTSFGDDVSNSPAFRTAVERGNGAYRQESLVDGVSRIGYVVSSNRYPIVVVVAYSTEYVEQQSRQFRAAIWSTTFGLSVAMLMVVLIGGRFMTLQKRLKAREVQTRAQQREAEMLDAISRVPGVAVLHVTPEGASMVGVGTDASLAAPLARFVRGAPFRALVRGLREPHLRNEHLSDGRNDLEVEVVVAPLKPMDTDGRTADDKEVVVFAVDQTQRRLEENKLYQMSKLASLGEVATGLAHEINQPLGVIRLAAANALNGMKAGLPPEHLTSKLDRIIQQTVRMSRIIDHMRIFGRKSDEQLQPSYPTDAVEGALQVVGAHFRLEHIEVTTEVEPDLPQVLCRQDQLEQVVINLLQNARDAINERRARLADEFGGRIAVRVGLEQVGNARAVVRIDVSDNGGGVPEDVLERIFQPFFTTKPPGKGTGLGLSVSFGIVRDHGGELSVRNGPEGAIFTIRPPAAIIPRARAAE